MKNDRIKRRLRDRISIRWKLFAYLAIFAAALLFFLWLFQIVLLDSFYKAVKTRTVSSAADSVERYLDSDTLADSVDDIADGNDICILILNDKYETIASAETRRACMIHNATPYMINKYVGMAEDGGGSASIMQSDSPGMNIPWRRNPQNQQPAEGGGTPDSALPETNGPLPGNNLKEPQDFLTDTDMPQSMVYIRLATFADGSRAIIMLNCLITPVDATVGALRIQLIFITGILALLSVLIASLISRKISKPMITINDSAKELAKGNYNTVFNSGGYLEISELNDTLNYAAKELATVERLRRELIANVSHDLRTPLTMITGYSEAMRDLPGENTPENIQIIIEETGRLTALVNDMLDLSKLQSGSVALNPAVFNLTELARSIAVRVGKFSGQDVIFCPEEEAIVEADETRISQVLYNLLNNAIYHGGTDKLPVEIRQIIDSTTVTIQIIDHGKGIPASQLPYIWDRYRKLSKESSKNVIDSNKSGEGYGLGLSIVKSVLELHSAAYGAESRENVGSCFWFTLKIHKLK